MFKTVVLAIGLALAAPQFPAGLGGLLNGGSPQPAPDGPPAIDTTFADAYQQVPTLDDFTPADLRPIEELPRTTDGAFVLKPGAYSSSLETFCLDLGAHAPDSDAAYLIAPLKGPQGSEIQSLLGRAYAHPEIRQDMLQMLIWSITSHVNLSNLSSGLQQIAQTLLSSAEVQRTNGAATSVASSPLMDMIMAQLPPEIRASLQSLQASRGALASGSNSYADVAGGLAKPVVARNVGIPRTRWTYLPPGYFVRFQTHSYQNADLQIYVPEGWTVHRDVTGRLASLESKLGSTVTLVYAAGGTQVQVSAPIAAVGGPLVQRGQGTITFTGAEPDDAAALRALSSAIDSSPVQSVAWQHLRDRALEDVAKARAELICRSLACDVGRNDSPPLAFSTASVIATPADNSLQPLAIAARPAGSPSAPPVDQCHPAHAGTPEDPIPVECLPEGPPRHRDCADVEQQIQAEQLARDKYLDPTLLAESEAAHEAGWQYAQRVNGAIADAVSGSSLGEQGVSAGSINGLPPSDRSNPASGTDTVGGLADTDMNSCRASPPSAYQDAPPVVRRAIAAHEAEHVVTCKSRPSDQRSQLDTPRARSADELRAYDVSLTILQKWEAAHCR